MNRQDLYRQIIAKKSCLCVGLDTDISKLPDAFLKYEDPIFEFNKLVIEATADLCVAYKPNLAFYEARGAAGWRSLEKTLEIIPANILTIADAKRGDIGNTAAQYAAAFFEHLGVDAITLSPYMGMDTLSPFLTYADKWVIVLGLTSNAGSLDFQLFPQQAPLFEQVLKKGQQISPDQLMFVIGATHPEKIAEIRALCPEHFFLVPGVGAQGGDLQAVLVNGWNSMGGLLINSSRGILYPPNFEKNPAESIRAAALTMQRQMETFINTLN